MITCNTIQKISNGKSTVLPRTLSFKLKWLPDGSPLNFKAQYCVQGEKQTEGVDYFKTHEAVISWSTVRLYLTLVLSNGWHTKNWTTPIPLPKQTSKNNYSLNIIEEPYLNTTRQRLWNRSRAYMGSNKICGNSLKNSGMDLSNKGFVQSELD